MVGCYPSAPSALIPQPRKIDRRWPARRESRLTGTAELEGCRRRTYRGTVDSAFYSYESASWRERRGLERSERGRGERARQ